MDTTLPRGLKIRRLRRARADGSKPKRPRVRMPSHQLGNMGSAVSSFSGVLDEPLPASFFLHFIDSRWLFLAFLKLLAMQCRIAYFFHSEKKYKHSEREACEPLNPT